MPWCLATIGNNAKFYAFDTSERPVESSFELKEFPHLEYDHKGTVLLNNQQLKQFRDNNVPLFDDKTYASKAAEYLGIRTWSYIEIHMAVNE